jgi:hypothetical protein
MSESSVRKYSLRNKEGHMNALRCIFILPFLFLLSADAYAQADSSEARTVFYVQSVKKGAEVLFRASLMFSGEDTALACREAQTPCEFSGAGDICIGMFEKIHGAAELRVVLLDRRPSGDRSLAEAVGNVVVMDKRHGEHTAVSF